MRSKSISTTCGLLVFALSVGACAPQKVDSKKSITPPDVGSEAVSTEQSPEASATESVEVVLTDKTPEEVIASLNNESSQSSKAGFGEVRVAEARQATESMGEAGKAESKPSKKSLAEAYKRRFDLQQNDHNKIEFGVNYVATFAVGTATAILAQKAERISLALSRVSDDFASVMRRMPDDFQERINKLQGLANEAAGSQKALDAAKTGLMVDGQSYAQAEKAYLDAQSEFSKLSRATSDSQTLSHLQQSANDAKIRFDQFKSKITLEQMTEIRGFERTAQNAVDAFKTADRALMMRVTRRIEAIGNGVADVFNNRASRLRSMEGAAKVQRIIVTGGSILVVAGVGKIIYDIGFDDDSVVIHAKVIEQLKAENPGYETVIDSINLGPQ